ncbi:hypothetical protein EK904_003381, partial [Melospiza melodia maxima]
MINVTYTPPGKGGFGLVGLRKLWYFQRAASGCVWMQGRAPPALWPQPAASFAVLTPAASFAVLTPAVVCW